MGLSRAIHSTFKESISKSEKDKIVGGKADGRSSKEFDAKELEMGITVESEHTKDKKIAEEIARDHLSEDPKYYSKLKSCGLADELNKSEILQKTDDAQAYRKRALSGMNLMYPVRIKGETHRPDNNIAYHSTIKMMNPKEDEHTDVHSAASQVEFHAPKPSEVGIEHVEFTGRDGNTIHALKLTGPHAQKMKHQHREFDHLGHDESYEFHPHISVDKETWDRTKASGAKTAHEAGIEFGHPELRQGNKILSRYHKSENSKYEKLEKGAIKNLATGLAVAGSIAASSIPNKAQPKQNTPASMEAPKNTYSSEKMLNAIANVESSGGRNINHAPVAGSMHQNESAHGSYGLMPQTIRETISAHKDLKSKHEKATKLQGKDLHNYMRMHPGLDKQIAQKHLQRLEHHFGQNPEHIGHSWLNGIAGTHKAIKNKVDISNHWHVLKIKQAYDKEK